MKIKTILLKVKKILILFTLTFICFNVSFSQCNDSIISSSSCHITGNSYTFSSNQNGSGFWSIKDSTSSIIASSQNSTFINHQFTYSGVYYISFFSPLYFCTRRFLGGWLINVYSKKRQRYDRVVDEYAYVRSIFSNIQNDSLFLPSILNLLHPLNGDA